MKQASLLFAPNTLAPDPEAHPMTLNIANLDRLISHLEGLPEERFNMGHVFTNADRRHNIRRSFNECGTAACLAGWCLVIMGPEEKGSYKARDWLNLDRDNYHPLFMPSGWSSRPQQYPLSRAIRTLKHMRAEFLRTGQVVVDWDAPEPAARKDWVAPKVSEQKLPAEITKLLTTFDRVEVL